MDADGSHVRPALRQAQEDAAPAWGNGGRRIYFSSLRTGSWEIFYVDLVTGEEVQLTKAEGYNRYPAWGPLPASK
jgi:Tol biopolymer transport system component